MRIIQYPITLIGGYNLFNYSGATDSESDGDPERPGIHMSAIEHSSLADIVSAFDLAPIDMNDNPDFIEHFHQTLLGEQTHWKIVRVIVDCYAVRLQLASEYYYKEHNQLYARTDTSQMSNEEENEFLDSLPEYIGYVNLEAEALQRVVLRFEVLPHEGCEDGNIVDVSLSSAGPVTVTEYDGNKKRIFKIRRPQTGVYCEYPAIVTEYM